MHLTELVLQGVRGFISPRKIAFKPGLNVVLGPKGSGKSTIRDVLVDLFFHRPVEKTAPDYQTTPSDAPCRAGMSFQAGDKLYRKVVDLAKGNTVFSRWNTENSTFENLSQDTDQIGKFFTQELKLTSREAYAIIFSSHSEEFPSKKSLGATTTVHQPGTQFQDQESLLREIQSLYKLREDALTIKKMQFELDGCHKDIFEYSDILKKEDEILKKMAEVKKHLDPLGRLPELPDDLERRIDEYDRISRKHQADLPHLNSDLHQFEEELSYLEYEPLQKDIKLIGGATLFVVSILVAMGTVGQDSPFGMSGGLFNVILLVSALGSFFLTFVQFFKFITAKQKHDNLQKEINNRQEKLKKLNRKFDVETSVIRNIMTALNVDTTSEMVTNIEKIQKLQSEMDHYTRQLDTEKAKPSYSKAKENLPELKKKASQLEQELQLLSATPLNPQEIDSQIQQLEAQAKRMGVATDEARGSTASKTQPDFDRGFVEKIGRDYFFHPTHRIIAVAAYVLGIDLKEFVQKLIGALDKNLNAFSFKNMGESRIDLDGTFSVVELENNTRVRFEQLELFKQDLVYFALKFTLLQFVLRDIHFPLILDSAFLSFDERIDPVIAKAISFLSQQTQIILLTDKELFAQGANHVERL